MRRRAVLLVLLGVAILVAALHQSVARAIVIAAIDDVTHMRVSFSEMQLGVSGASFTRVRVQSGTGEPIATIARLNVQYDLADFIFGGSRKYGLRSIAVDRPALTIIRNRDGTFNLPMPTLSHGAGGGPPLVLQARIRDGSVTFVDRTLSSAQQRPFAVAEANVSADVDTAARTAYVLSAAYVDRARRFPIRAEGLVDQSRPIDLQHVWAPRLPIADLMNFIVRSNALHVDAGELTGLDVRVFGISRRGAAIVTHVFGGVRLSGGRISVNALTAPLTDIHGSFAITESAVTTDGIDARLGSMAATLRGGVYDLAHPQARLVLAARARLEVVRTLARAAAHLPVVAGPVAVRVLVEGSVLHPTAMVAVDSPNLTYNGVTFTGTSFLAGASTQGIDVLHAQTAYGAIHVGVAGDLGLRPASARLLMRGSSPASSLPFVSGVLPGMTLHATAFATAPNLRHIELSGFIDGATRTQHASALFAVGSNGVGSVGPIFMGNARHWVYARIDIDHPHARIAALADAHDFAIAPAPPVPLGNFRVSKVPLVPGAVSGAILGAQQGKSVIVRVRGGTFVARGGAAWIRDLDASVAMHGSAVDVSSASARVLGGDAQAVGGLRGGGGRLVFLLSGARLDDARIGGSGFVSMHGRTLRIGDVLLDAAGAVVTGQGRIAMTGTHAYAIDGRVRALDLHRAATVASPRFARDVTGSADARVSIRGSGGSPHISGEIAIPEGSFDGQGFTALGFHLSGGTAGMSLDAGRVAVGSSRIAFHGVVSPGASTIAIAAPHVNLADFNDLFDAGDTLAGTGGLDLMLATGPRLRTSGSARLTGARFRQYDLGNASATWGMTGEALSLRASSASPTGRFAIAGSIVPPATLDLSLHARDVAVGAWAPPLMLRAPIVGTASASATVRGRYPALDIAASASVDRAMVGRVPVRRMTFSGTLRGTRGTIHSLTLAMPYLTASASGRFGLSKSAPFDLRAQAESPDIGLLATTTSGKKNPLAGSLITQARLTGTMSDPKVSASIDVHSLAYRTFALPRVRGTLTVSRRAVALSSGEADFSQGRILASGHVPIRPRGHGARVAGAAPITAHVVAQSVALANFASFLPHGSELGGALNGAVDVGGTTTSPALSGTVQLQNGAYSGPLDKAALDDISGSIVLSRQRIQLQSLRARAGAGSLAGSGTILLPSLLSPGSATLALALVATHATFDSPNYFSGQIDARVSGTYSRGKPATLRGNVAVSHATIPLSALYHPSSSSSPAKLPSVAFHLGIAVGPDVAIKNSVVNVGGAGNALLTGTLAHPVMAGSFSSTGGTVNFYQLFRVQHATVTFSPSTGITPYVDATASTIVAQPPTTIRINVTGPATDMQLALHSTPEYSRSQILGLLVGMQSFGAVQGVPTPTGSPFTASSVVSRVGFGEANRVFTQSILNPIATTLGGALGTQNLQLYSNIGSGYGTGIGASIVKRISQYVTMTTSANIGYPRQEDVKMRYERTAASNVVLEVYQQQQTFLNSAPPGLQQGPGNLGLMPSDEMFDASASGVLLRFERRYWSCGLFHYCLSCSQC